MSPISPITMSKTSSLFFIHLRRNPNSSCRLLCTLLSPHDQNLSKIADNVCDFIRTQPEWKTTLISQFPSFDFANPNFFNEVIQRQNDAVLSFHLFNWLNSNYGFSPDPNFSNYLFDALVDAKDGILAKSFLDNAPQLHPNSVSLEKLLCVLFHGWFLEEGLDLIGKLKSFGVCPSLETWKLGLYKAIHRKRTDIFWGLYGEMMDSGVVTDVEIVGFLIQAFCFDGKAVNGYEVLIQVREDGIIPSNDALNILIQALSEAGDFDRVSEILHMMIVMNQNPDLGTYQGIIEGLCKRGRDVEAFRIFNELKERGYEPDRVMYTTMIQGFCQVKLMEKARNLWSEMKANGVVPNDHTYSVLIHGYCRANDIEEARKIVQEMFDSGYKMDNVCYNSLIYGLCKNGMMKEACDVFEEMGRDGVAPDVITYNTLIQGFCRQEDLDSGLLFFNKLLSDGLMPSTYSFTPFIEILCRSGRTQEALEFWTEMLNSGLEPFIYNRECIIEGLCKEGSVMEGFQWFSDMLELKLIPQKKVFEIVIISLSEHDMLDAALAALNSMISVGFKLDHIISTSLVRKLCSTSPDGIEHHFQDVISTSQFS